MMTKWTKGDDVLLRKLWADDVPTALIAVRLARSANSVIGRAHRLGLRKRKRQPRGRNKKQAAAPTGAVPAFVKQQAPVTLMGLREGMCKFPMDGEGGTVYCGQKAKPGTSWCDTHRAVVFRPVPPRKLDMRKV